MADVSQHEFTARQRKHVYHHSSIFDEGGPTTKSVYAPSRQQELHGHLSPNLRKNNQHAPNLDIPRPADMNATQNAGHGVVAPSDHAHHQPLKGAMPRATCREAFAGEGEAIKVVKASGKDGAIPQEFWATSVNVQWHDPRNELRRTQRGDVRDAQELKRMELSSEVFGKDRMLQASTHEPRKELLAETEHIMGKDSSLDPGFQPNGKANGGYPARHDANSRFQRNLGPSALNTHAGERAGQEAERLPTPMGDENKANNSRRRQEKNFSDLFGCEMGDRKDVRDMQREEVIGTRTCSFLDTRSEIAVRNQKKWSCEHDGFADQSVRRKDEERSSRLFEYDRPDRPVERDDHRVHHSERVCWDTKEGMHTGSEIARRRRMKDHHHTSGATIDGVTPTDRKLEDMASGQTRIGMGVAPEPYDSPREYRSQYESSRAPVSTRPAQRGGYSVTAKDTKLASLQSSIFS